jgi:hypothetical protein
MTNKIVQKKNQLQPSLSPCWSCNKDLFIAEQFNLIFSLELLANQSSSAKLVESIIISKSTIGGQL